MSTMDVCTGLSHGNKAYPEHAAKAVKKALDRAGLSQANGVLLFLTPEYASDPIPALRAAAKAAGCLQIIGCTGAGLLTEEEWVLDSPGAAAMVFGNHIHLDIPSTRLTNEELRLSFCTPAGMTADWLDTPAPRLGAVSGDVFGQGPFVVWSGGRINDGQHVDTVVKGATGVLLASQGVHALTSPIEVAEVEGYDVRRLGNYPALNVLVQSLPEQVREMKRLPFHLIMGGVTIGDPATAIRDGRYRLNHIISANLTDQSITLSHPLHPGERLFWAMRDALTAEQAMQTSIKQAEQQLGTRPDFGFLFPCMGRGPHFYGNRDRDLEVMKSRFPGMPIIGFYGNGEIGPLDGANHLYQYSAVAGLFKAN
ncbi:MAG: FIST C-terminal domain-containing protein [Gammaproteobacteria bacterium]|nr:FIST C-terminal domain-containing protein [Gammaproteobacteria bacterium]